MKVSSKDRKKAEISTKLMKASAHPLRICILLTLSNAKENRLSVKSLYETLKIEQPVASHHLGILMRSGILKRTNEGGITYYAILKDDDHVNALIKYISA